MNFLQILTVLILLNIAACNSETSDLRHKNLAKVNDSDQKYRDARELVFTARRGSKLTIDLEREFRTLRHDDRDAKAPKVEILEKNITFAEVGEIDQEKLTLTIQINADAVGEGTIYLAAKESTKLEDVLLVRIRVDENNTAPQCNGVQLNVDEDASVTGKINCVDADADPISLTLLEMPTLGNVQMSTDNSGFTYQPQPNANGVDNFVFEASDRYAVTRVSVQVVINAIPDLPIAKAMTLTTDEDTPLNTNLESSHPDNLPLQHIIVQQPTRGFLEFPSGLSSPSIRYTPTLNLNGDDSFTYKVSDGTNFSETVNVIISVKPVDDLPVVQNTTMNLNEDSQGTIVFSASDADGETLTYEVSTAPTRGTITGQIYKPEKDFFGNDQLTFRAKTTAGVYSNTANISIVVNSVNDAPTAVASSLTTAEGNPVSGNVSATDPDHTTFTYSVATQPTNGQASINSSTGAITYTPNLNFFGVDNFTFRASDGSLDSTATIAITVTPVNDPLVAVNTNLNVEKDKSTSITPEFQNPDQDTVTLTITTQPQHGTLQQNGAQVTYTPTAGYVGADLFKFKGQSPNEMSNEATVTLEIGAGFQGMVAAGYNYTCVVDKQGLKCWGDNRRGQSNVPTGLTGIKEVEAGYHHTCVIADQGLKCWGSNDYGQTTVPSGLTGIKKLATGSYHTCAIADQGLKCWGKNSYGQATVPSGLTGIKAVAAGLDNTCAISEQGLRCWGYDFMGNTNAFGGPEIKAVAAGGDHTCAIAEQGLRCWGGYNSSVPSGLTGLKALESGFAHACAIADQGLKCWRSNSHGQTSVPGGLTGIKAVAAGGDHTCAISDQGLKCWGNNNFGQTSVPMSLTSIKAVAAGGEHTCAIAYQGLNCWGYNYDGETNVPSGLTGIQAVATGLLNTCAIADQGLKCWGSNQYGTTNVPSGLTGIKAVATGVLHACAMADQGIKCWGDNTHGQTSVPSYLTGIKFVASGEYHNCAIADQGLKCWGNNKHGYTNVPGGLTGINAVAAGGDYTCVIADQGLKCWGYNGYGQTSVPSDMTGIKAVAAGGAHTCVISDQGIRCWGNNIYGQTNVPSGLTGITKVSCGPNNTCAISDQGLTCWGKNEYGQSTVQYVDL